MAGDGRFLVKWIPTTHDKGKSGAYDNHCISWIRHEDFLFPVLARRYLSREVNSNVCIQVWIEDCKERERCLNCMNTFDTDEDEYNSHLELDFCCFLCKCPWDHPLKHTIRNCEQGLKFHRGCCHGYENVDAFESSFVSPIGKVQLELLEQLADENDENKGEEAKNNVTYAIDKKVAETSQNQSTSPVTAATDGNCERFLQCLKIRTSMLRRKRDAL